MINANRLTLNEKQSAPLVFWRVAVGSQWLKRQVRVQIIPNHQPSFPV
jgi:hypothetical protein